MQISLEMNALMSLEQVTGIKGDKKYFNFASSFQIETDRGECYSLEILIQDYLKLWTLIKHGWE